MCRDSFAQVSLQFYDSRVSDSWVTPTPQQLKALTHPVRVRMLGLLRIDGPATATTLAQRLGLNTGATSYHLRQLATHGFVEDDPERGTGRERWWRAAHGGTRTAPVAPDDSEAADTLDAYLQSVVTLYAGLFQGAMEERPLLPEPWRRASTWSDATVRLTPERATEVVERLTAVMEEVEDMDEGEMFVLNLNAFPLPGRIEPA